MSFEVILILSILLLALVAFVNDRIPPDLTAILVMVTLMITGILTPREGISGFSNPATITILALFFVSKALEKTGTIRSLGDLLLSVSRNRVGVNVLFISLIAGIASAFINTTAVVIVFLPIVLRLSKIRNISPTLLLMPLSFGAIIGGASTTIGTSTNLIIRDVASSLGETELGIFEFTHIGVILLVIISVYMVFASRFILREKTKKENLIKDYNVRSYLTEVKIKPESKWIGMAIGKLPILKSLEIDIMEIIRGKDEIVVPTEEDEIRKDDILIIRINSKNFILLKEIEGLQIYTRKEWADRDLVESGMVLLEMIINTNAAVIGKTVIDSKINQRYNSVVLGIISGKNRFLRSRMKEIKLHFGDTLLVETNEKSKQQFYEDNDFIILNEFKRPEFRESKRWISIATMFGIIILAATGVLPILTAALAGAAILVITGCINMAEAYKSIEWKIIFMLAGLIPLGLAMEKTGTADVIADMISYVITPLPTFWALFVLYMFITFITSIVYNNATAVILAPIVINLAPAIGVSVLPLMALLMFAANCCFLTPIGYQTNLLIYGPGKYQFRDFAKVGAPLCIILGLVCSYLITIWY